MEWGTVYATGPGTLVLNATDSGGANADSNVITQDETGFTSVLTEDSDSYYSFFIIQEAFSITTQDTQSDNEFLEDQSLTILDFTESNPFGDPTESV